jgi:hypothetical protein
LVTVIHRGSTTDQPNEANVTTNPWSQSEINGVFEELVQIMLFVL